MGTLMCAECRTELSEAYIKQQFKLQHVLNWKYEWEKLRIFRREVRHKNRLYRRKGYMMAEAIYTQQPLDLNEHKNCWLEEKARMIAEDHQSQMLGCTLLPALSHHLK
jgi:hypothetical protein